MFIMLKRESVIIGTLYALGYRKKEIMNHYLLYPMVISLEGGILGTMLGLLTFELSKLLNRKKINRISMAEALKSRME